MSGMAGGKGNSGDGGKPKKGGGFWAGVRQFGSDFAESLARNLSVNVSAGSIGKVQRKPSPLDYSEQMHAERQSAVKQVHRSLKAWDERAPLTAEPNVHRKADDEAAGAEVEADQVSEESAEATTASEPNGGGTEEKGTKPATEPSSAGEDEKSEENAADEGMQDSQSPEEKPLSVAAKLRGVHRKVFRAPNPTPAAAPEVKSPTDGQAPQMAQAAANQANQVAAQPAANTVKPVVKIEPIIGKVTQAKQMVDMWVTKGVPTAPELAAMINAVLPKLQDAAAGAATAADLKAKLTAVAADLQAIAIKDKEWKFYSLESAGQTLLNAQKQLSVELDAFTCKMSLPLAEFQSQIQQSQQGLNSLLVKDWEQNRSNYKKGQEEGGAGGGRSSVGTSMQKKFNDRHGRPLQGAAPHNPDQIAGGSPDPTGLPANVRVNSAIGPQWDTPGRVQKLDKAVKEYKEKEGEPAAAVTQMNVTLSVVQVPDPK